MPSHIAPVGPLKIPMATQATQQTLVSQERAVKAQVDTLGGAANYAAQSAVQKRQDVENRKKTGRLIDRKITTATLAALEPVGSAHDEDEADAERSQAAFGSELPFGSTPPSWARNTKR